MKLLEYLFLKKLNLILGILKILQNISTFRFVMKHNFYEFSVEKYKKFEMFNSKTLFYRNNMVLKGFYQILLK